MPTSGTVVADPDAADDDAKFASSLACLSVSCSVDAAGTDVVITTTEYPGCALNKHTLGTPQLNR
jgi:hypothetical protein